MVPKSRDHRAGGHGLVANLQRRPVMLALAAFIVMGYALNVTQFGNKSSSLRSFDRVVASERQQDAVIDDGLDDATRKRCYDERDYGMIEKLRESRRNLCDDDTDVDPALGPLSTYTYYYTPGSDIRGTVVRNLWVDMRGAEVHRPIKDLSQDGGGHDPRLKYPSVGVHCVCRGDQNQNTSQIPHVWEFMFGAHPDTEKKQPWRFCNAFKSKAEQDVLASGFTSRPWNKTLIKEHKKQHEKDGVALVTPHPSGWPYQIHHVKTNAIIMGRRDDHNPFFMIAAAMHSWIMMKVLEWSPETTQLVYFDDAIPAETDELQRLMLAPSLPVVNGRDIMGSMLRFDKALVAPFEFWGPMMRHLGSDEPCRRNKMIEDFRDEVMAKYKVSHEKKDPKSCTVTIISRRPYKGRNVQRKWLNEDAIVDRMMDEYVRDPSFYKYGTCLIQSIDFVDLPLDQQMRVIVESDVIIGMHGAGMVNLMWARPGTVVVEIFPKNRHRWGYKNLCFFNGCEWHQFRDGKDTGRGKGDNSSDKLISYADWFPFFDPIMRKAIRALEARVASVSDFWR